MGSGVRSIPGGTLGLPVPGSAWSPRGPGQGQPVKPAKTRILVVDDAGAAIVLCVNVLQALGYAVRGANSGERALELLAEEPFDLMMVDYKMPGMTGLEVFQRARAICPDLAVMLVTGHGTPEIVKEATQMGFSSILLKPFTPDELRRAAREALLTKA